MKTVATSINHLDEPAIDIGKICEELESLGCISSRNGAYLQTGDNCLEIANYLAKRLGYIPLSRAELKESIFSAKARRLGWITDDGEIESNAYFVIREPDNPQQVHVTFELNGKEYNFGAGEASGFYVETHTPLKMRH